MNRLIPNMDKDFQMDEGLKRLTAQLDGFHLCNPSKGIAIGDCVIQKSQEGEYQYYEFKLGRCPYE